MFLSNDALERLSELCADMGEDVLELREAARVQALFLWRVSPKMHKMLHIPLYAACLNPRWLQNYAEVSCASQLLFQTSVYKNGSLLVVRIIAV